MADTQVSAPAAPAVTPTPAPATPVAAASPEPVPTAPSVVVPEGTPATPAAATPPAEKDQFARKFAALARKEAEVREQADEVKQLKKKAADLEAQLQKLQKPAAPALPIEQKLENLERRIETREEERTKREAEQQAADEKHALDAWQKEVRQEIAASETHEFVKVEDDATEDVIRVMTAHWNEHGTIMKYKDALDTVEAFYEEKFAKRAALAKAKKLVGVAPPVQEASQVIPVTPQPAAQQVTPPEKTLTGAMTAQTPARSSTDTAADRMARAIKIIQDAHGVR